MQNKMIRATRNAIRLAPWGKLGAGMALVAVTAARSQAAISTNISNIVDDLTTFFGSIQTLVISVVVFGLAIGYAKLLRRK